MYINEGEPTEKCGDLNFGLEYDFATQTLKLKIIQVLNILYFQFHAYSKDMPYLLGKIGDFV